ncbi:MAG TPA: WD40 repeat domain-containing protein [Streptosporangiaceae bacterium]
MTSENVGGGRFWGRSAALREVAGWLGREAVDPQALVVTGGPGAGKSALLAQAGAGPGCAVDARGKTALDVAVEVAGAASATLPDYVWDLEPSVRVALAGRGVHRFGVVIDGLDEAATPAEAREIVSAVVLPLLQPSDEASVQVVVGARRSDTDGDLLAAFGESTVVIDLDEPEFFDEDDLVAHARASLRLAGGQRPGSPEQPDEAIARSIAAAAGRSFLVAGLAAWTHACYGAQLPGPATVTAAEALRHHLGQAGAVGDVTAEALLTALAFAEPPGIPLEFWRTAVQAITGSQVTAAELARFARSPAMSVLVEAAGDGEDSAFRLAHQAFADALRQSRSQIAAPQDDERALTQAFTAIGTQRGWAQAPGYLLRSLPAHAAQAGMIDELLADDGYLLHADLRRLIPLAGDAGSEIGYRRATLLRETPWAIAAGPPARTALFSVTASLENLGRSFSFSDSPAPYRATWASVLPRTERATLEGHTGAVHAVCAFEQDGRTLLATGSDDKTVRIWNPGNGALLGTLEGHTDWVYAVCAFEQDGKTLLATGSDDTTVRIWDPATRTELATLAGHTGAVHSVCAFTGEGATLLASSGDENVIRIWDPAAGTQIRSLAGHTDWVNAVCAFRRKNRTLLASGSDDSTVRIWDPATGALLLTAQGHTGAVNAVCALQHEGAILLASGSDDATVRIWEPGSGMELAALEGHSNWINTVCAFHEDAFTKIVTGSDDHTVRIWDLTTGTQRAMLEGHTGAVFTTCAFQRDGETLLASGGDDDTVRIWNPPARGQRAAPKRHTDWVNAVCVFFSRRGRRLLASGGDENLIRIWDPATNAERLTLEGHGDWVHAICSFSYDDRTFLATGSDDHTVRIWNPAAKRLRATLRGHTSAVNAVCALTHDGNTLVASGGDDRTIRIWNAANNRQEAILRGHDGSVLALCAFERDGTTLLASGGHDRTVRIWDLATGTQQAALEGHAGLVLAVSAFSQDGATLLASGGDDSTVRIWDPATGTQQAVLEGHSDWVHAVCAFTHGGQTLLASGGSDDTVRIWDPASQAPLLVIPVHHQAKSLAYSSGTLIVALTEGVLTLDLSPSISDW